jgi:hypothetical protein
MKNKKFMYIIGIIIVLILIFKDKIMKIFKTVPTGKIIGDAPTGFKQVKAKYGSEFAKNLERMMRKETNHFKSGQWLGTGTPGMEATSTTFPYGWSIKEWITSSGSKLTADDFFLQNWKDNHTGKPTNFVGFKNTKDSVNFVGWFIQNKRKGDVVSWYRLPNTGYDADRAKYLSEMMKIETHFV